MPRQAWSKKRERQYLRIKEALVKQGDSEDEAEEIAARTVNKVQGSFWRVHPSEPDIREGSLLAETWRPSVP
jgi:plasmid stabilization system protein ParE